MYGLPALGRRPLSCLWACGRESLRIPGSTLPNEWGEHLDHLRVVFLRIPGDPFEGIDTAEANLDFPAGELVDGSREALGDLASSIEAKGLMRIVGTDCGEPARQDRQQAVRIRPASSARSFALVSPLVDNRWGAHTTLKTARSTNTRKTTTTRGRRI